MHLAHFTQIGTDKDSPIICIAGFIFHKSIQSSFETEYNKLMKSYPEKNSEKPDTEPLMGDIQEHKIINIVSDDEFFIEMGELLRKFNAKAIYSALIKEAWDNLPKSDKFLEQFPSPYFLCFEDILRQLWEWTGKYSPSEKSQPIFSRHSDYDTQIHNYSQLLLQTGWYNKYLLPVNLGTLQSHAFLQAADFCAHSISDEIQYREIHNRFGQKNEAFNHATNRRMALGHWFNEVGLMRTIKRFNETGEIYSLKDFGHRVMG